MSRQERRQQLRQSIDIVSKRGLDLKAAKNEQWWSVAAATRILYDILDGRSPARASQAAKRAHQFFETSLAYNPSAHKIECAKGCAFCCHVSVTAMAPEIFLIASHLRDTFANDLAMPLARIRSADQSTRGISRQERAARKLPCGLLENNACTVYSVRPAACRGMTSVSMTACESAFNGASVQIGTPFEWTRLRSAHKQALWAALVAAELPAESYELHHALVRALEAPDTETRWLAGEDIFAGVAKETVGPADRENNRKIIDQLVAGALGKELPAQ